MLYFLLWPPSGAWGSLRPTDLELSNTGRSVYKAGGVLRRSCCGVSPTTDSIHHDHSPRGLDPTCCGTPVTDWTSESGQKIDWKIYLLLLFIDFLEETKATFSYCTVFEKDTFCCYSFTFLFKKKRSDFRLPLLLSSAVVQNKGLSERPRPHLRGPCRYTVCMASSAGDPVTVSTNEACSNTCCT